MDLNQAIREIVREVLEERIDALRTEPEMIGSDEARKFLGGEKPLDKSVFIDLVRNRERNGFPAVVLGPRTIKVDKTRLKPWTANGGLELKA